jgi:hypothetical protein
VTRVRKPKWTKEKIVEALRAWEKEHDRRPVRGVTQQSLGKRVAKYRGREYEAKTWVRNPHAGRTPNRKDVPTPSDTASG